MFVSLHLCDEVASDAPHFVSIIQRRYAAGV